MLLLNKLYTHYKNQEKYLTINFCKIQENDSWVDAIIYKPYKHPDNCEELFVRTVKEFEEKFKAI
jgi:hypothetical protein